MTKGELIFFLIMITIFISVTVVGVSLIWDDVARGL